jgi:hypothetical protein
VAETITRCYPAPGRPNDGGRAAPGMAGPAVAPGLLSGPPLVTARGTRPIIAPFAAREFRDRIVIRPRVRRPSAGSRRPMPDVRPGGDSARRAVSHGRQCGTGDEVTGHSDGTRTVGTVVSPHGPGTGRGVTAVMTGSWPQGRWQVSAPALALAAGHCLPVRQRDAGARHPAHRAGYLTGTLSAADRPGRAGSPRGRPLPPRAWRVPGQGGQADRAACPDDLGTGATARGSKLRQRLNQQPLAPNLTPD